MPRLGLFFSSGASAIDGRREEFSASIEGKARGRAAGPRPAAGSRKGERCEGVQEQLSMARRGSRWSSLRDICSAPASGKDEDARHGGDEARV